MHLKIIFKRTFYEQVIDILPGYYNKYIYMYFFYIYIYIYSLLKVKKYIYKIFFKLKNKLILLENYTT